MATAADGPYIGLEGGANFQNNQNVTQSGTGIGSLQYKTGFIGGLTFGNAFAMGWRPEIELDWRRNDLKSANGFGVGGASAGGFNNADSAMANLWYDLRMPEGPLSVIHPYIGGGVGGIRDSYRNIEVGGFVAPRNSYDTVFAYQGGAGVAFDATTHLVISADYRFIQSNRGTYDVGAIGGPVSARYRANTAMIGIKYMFGEPPAPPPPPPPPPPVVLAPPPPPPPPPPPVCHAPPGFKVDANCHIIQQTLVVRAIDFEFNSSQLTVPAQQSLDEVAGALAAQPELAIEIDGYTDNIGGAAYNQRLSQKRAESVKSYLVSKGVNGAGLSAHGFGKDKPIADNSTAEGRAQNRRVEFVITNAPAGVNVVPQGASAESTAAAEQGQQPHMVKKRHHKHHHHPVDSQSQPATPPAQ